MAALVFKVALLTLKTAAKPLASRFEATVMNHPVWRKKVVDMAQWIHRQDVLINRGAEGKTGKAFVASMTEEKAMQLASKVVSEGFLYGMGVVLVVVEIQRKNKEDGEKQAKAAAEKQAIKELHEQHVAADKQLKEELATLGRHLQQMDERLAFMEQQMGRRRSWLPLFGSG
ncbi:optic atrophy 3-like protein [Micractinium conductrix]|uniref:Optic atrophy 3-like protein n=1 Tax=Micractinium conductrix TaxID=554055 RepID=A0A2P6VS02_9CHLO|nr:optic atrophy 3-like protein [Micractinium conductrix]|eukprot:PSC76876.1 optic atrophy 3-like protein [Micractinium conductrix]